MGNTERAVLGVLIGGGLGYIVYNALISKTGNKQALNYLLFGVVLLAIYEYRDFKSGKDSFFDFGAGGQKSKAIEPQTTGVELISF